MMEVLINNGQTWLICGGRDFADQDMFDSAMGDLMRAYGCPARIVHGDATGADAMAEALAIRLAIDKKPYPADWDRYGKPAGPIRNSQMLKEENVRLVVAFPGKTGTADMMRKARKAGIDVAEIVAQSHPTGCSST